MYMKRVAALIKRWLSLLGRGISCVIRFLDRLGVSIFRLEKKIEAYTY